MGERNWAGNYRYRAGTIHRPSSLEELQEIVARAPRIRVLGSRHSFTGIADSDELVTLGALPSSIQVDNAVGKVTLGAATTYGELAEALNAHGLALRNLGALPHVCVAGSVATATHGSGDRNGNLATSVMELEIVTSSGDVVSYSRGDPDFEGVVVGLGALGAVVRLTLEVEPAYRVQQRVFEDLAWSTLLDSFDEITSSGYSVSLFTRWSDRVDQVWIKSRSDDVAQPWEDDFLGARPAPANRHPIDGLDPVNCTPQMGVPGPWHERLPHFRMGFMPSSGKELQSEYLVPRAHAIDALEAVRALGDAIRPLLQVSEIRTVAADGLWMSPQYGSDTIAIHFTWKPRQGGVESVLPSLEEALAPFHARPHWGKLFHAAHSTIEPLYERISHFGQLVERLDSRGAFRNAWLATHVLERG